MLSDYFHLLTVSFFYQPGLGVVSCIKSAEIIPIRSNLSFFQAYLNLSHTTLLHLLLLIYIVDFPYYFMNSLERRDFLVLSLTILNLNFLNCKMWTVLCIWKELWRLNEMICVKAFIVSAWYIVGPQLMFIPCFFFLF